MVKIINIYLHKMKYVLNENILIHKLIFEIFITYHNNC